MTVDFDQTSKQPMLPMKSDCPNEIVAQIFKDSAQLFLAAGIQWRNHGPMGVACQDNPLNIATGTKPKASH